MTLLAVDPGRSKAQPTIGYCLFDSNGREMERGELTWEDLAKFYHLRGLSNKRLYFGEVPVHNVVVENWVNDPNVRRGGQTNGASEVIGALEILALQSQTPFYRQDRSELTVAKMHAQYVTPRGHLPHRDSAYLHGHHWLVGQGVIRATGVDATL